MFIFYIHIQGFIRACIISLPARWSWSNETLQQWRSLLNSHLFKWWVRASHAQDLLPTPCLNTLVPIYDFPCAILHSERYCCWVRWTPQNASCIITKPSKCSSVPDRWCQKWHLNRQHASFWKAVDESICVRAYFIPQYVDSGMSVMIDSSQHFVAFSEWISHCSTAQTLILLGLCNTNSAGMVT